MKLRDIIMYFILTVVILSSIGVWLPYCIDFFFQGKIKQDTSDAFAGNLMTYYLAIFTVGIIDRILSIIENSNYNFKKTEFLILVLVSIICFFITFMAFKNIFHKDFLSASYFAWGGTALSFIIWWLSKSKDIDNPNAILGSEIK